MFPAKHFSFFNVFICDIQIFEKTGPRVLGCPNHFEHMPRTLSPVFRFSKSRDRRLGHVVGLLNLRVLVSLCIFTRSRRRFGCDKPPHRQSHFRPMTSAKSGRHKPPAVSAEIVEIERKTAQTSVGTTLSRNHSLDLDIQKFSLLAK